VLKPFKQTFGFQEKHAAAMLGRSQIGLPCVFYKLFYTLKSPSNILPGLFGR
jgi:hypothetical protein